MHSASAYRRSNSRSLLMADKQPKLPIPRVAPAHKIMTGKRKKTEDDYKKDKKKEIDRARNKTRVNIGAAFPRWRELRVLKGLKTDAELATFLLDNFQGDPLHKTSTPTKHQMNTDPIPALSRIIGDSSSDRFKQESEDIKIEEVFSVKQEETEEPTGLMPQKEESQELNNIEDKDQYEKHQDLMTEEKSTKMEKTQKTNSNRYLNCGQCGKSFNRKQSLTIHMVVHTGEKPFSCNRCGKSFTQIQSLNVHKRIHTGKSCFTCQECGKIFIQKQNLKVHMRIHTGEKPFSCSDCGQSFAHKNSLKAHIRKHTGEKLFTCAQCGKSFSTVVNLRYHMNIHTRETIY